MKYLFVLSLLFGIHSFAQTGSIKGQVMDENNIEIPFAKVWLTSQDSSFKSAMMTNLDGKYTFKNLPSGTYEVHIKSIGYTEHLIKDVVVTDNKESQATISLVQTQIISCCFGCCGYNRNRSTNLDEAGNPIQW
ncbi:carboxypeptidase-like regulatory domain-containing protein [Paracrocinitomix mangrovi]|uniref:carboxypeptidase-like regulatory domain-containing protein n=1 Tax=Paracrocinitomix mangrovi TaxID=2862509 RepID=UPI001C8D418E|nr:carboxypeptidase-like regulatory domain-containing protein [Paracrocinitomix mangrovi]UKN00151.1 carboxypeptidase-like regulatory domain-containing protein [Paracrocinitomix mangrovi]